MKTCSFFIFCMCCAGLADYQMISFGKEAKTISAQWDFHVYSL